jgi:hypothetical protein
VFENCGYYDGYYYGDNPEDLIEQSDSIINFDERLEQYQENNNERDLIAFNIYRDGVFLDTVEAGIYAYDDHAVENLTEYCYTVTSVYEVGESPIDDDSVCATPVPGVEPTDLYAYGDTDHVTVEWQQVNGYNSNNIINYNIYKDGTLYDQTTSNMYEDLEAEHDVEYCYIVSANYPSGESLFTNQSCAMWVLAAPLSISASGGNGFIQVDWTEPGVSTCADEVIPSTWIKPFPPEADILKGAAKTHIAQL